MKTKAQPEMADQQLLTLALAVIIPLSLLLYSNSRITDTKETLRAEIQGLRTEIHKDMALLEARMDARFNSMDRKLDEILRLLGDHETRVTALEQRPH